MLPRLSKVKAVSFNTYHLTFTVKDSFHQIIHIHLLPYVQKLNNYDFCHYKIFKFKF